MVEDNHGLNQIRRILLVIAAALVIIAIALSYQFILAPAKDTVADKASEIKQAVRKATNQDFIEAAEKAMTEEAAKSGTTRSVKAISPQDAYDEPDMVLIRKQYTLDAWLEYMKRKDKAWEGKFTYVKVTWDDGTTQVHGVGQRSGEDKPRVEGFYRYK